MSTTITYNSYFFSALPMILSILVIAGKWGIFEKMGEEGWKVLIPFYGEYILYKRVWSKKMYWITLALSLLSFPVLVVGAFSAYGYVSGTALLAVCMCLAGAVLVFLAITKLMLIYKLSKSFGQGKAFAFGLLMISSVFYMLLGFGNYEYARA